MADAKKQLSLPRIVVICGSTRFMTEADLRETKAGKVVVKPGCDMKSPHELWSDPVEAEALKVRLDDLHRAKIRLAEEVLVVGDYIGDSTRAEIAYARSLGKPVRFTHPEVDPEAWPPAATSTTRAGSPPLADAGVDAMPGPGAVVFEGGRSESSAARRGIRAEPGRWPGPAVVIPGSKTCGRC